MQITPEAVLFVNVFSAGFAFAAALLWLLSTKPKTPGSFPIIVKFSNDPMTKSFGGSDNDGVAICENFNVLARSLTKQSNFNAWAARMAAVAAVLQGVASILSSYVKLA